MKTVTSETHTKATASLQEQINTELLSEGLEISVAELLQTESESKEKAKEKENNENPTGQN